MKQLGGALIGFVLTGSAVAAACSAVCPDKTCIEDRVCELLTPYNPIAFKTGETYTSPDCSKNGRIPIGDVTDYKTKMAKIYNAAPKKFQDELCKLKNVFLLPGGMNQSWGKYEDSTKNQNGTGPDKPGNGNSYVFLENGLVKEKIMNVTTERLNKLPKIGALDPQPYHEHVKGAKPKDIFELAIASELAHEIGHIKFHRDINDLTCLRGGIFDVSWDKNNLGTTLQDRWRDYGDDIGKHDPQYNVPKPAEVNNLNDVNTIYTGGFASGLAAASPEEDFVETYTLAVLKKFSTDV